MKSHVLLTVWCNISGGAGGEIWLWSLSGVKGLNLSQHICELLRVFSRKGFRAAQENSTLWPWRTKCMVHNHTTGKKSGKHAFGCECHSKHLVQLISSSPYVCCNLSSVCVAVFPSLTQSLMFTLCLQSENCNWACGQSQKRMQHKAWGLHHTKTCWLRTATACSFYVLALNRCMLGFFSYDVLERQSQNFSSNLVLIEKQISHCNIQ